MDKKLDIKLFRFNHETDYLPYYRSFKLTCNETDTVLSLLSKLNQNEPFGFEGVESCGVKINNLFTNVNVTIKELTKKLSCNELTIEPVSIYRAIKDLTITNKDFADKLALFGEYLTEKQLETYAHTLQMDYYASNTLNFNKDYIGDHALIIAHDIIEQNPELEKEILELISDKDNGVWFHTSVTNRMFSVDSDKQAKITNLVAKVTKNQTTQESFNIKTVKVDQEFIGFNIAAYDTNDTCSLQTIVEQSKASFISTESQNDDLAFHSEEADKNFSFKIAGKILLDAVDNNADFILVNNKKNFTLLDNNQKEIEKAVGRDINLPIVTTEQFSNLLAGEKDPVKLGFDKHKVAVSFL